jgi:hypothetical protein
LEAPDAHSTFYQAFVGPGASFEGARGVPLASYGDGPGETILVVEAMEAVPWTKPGDLPYAAGQPVPPVGGLFSLGAYAAFADGSVRPIPRNVSEATLRALITRNGGDRPGPDLDRSFGPKELVPR